MVREAFSINDLQNSNITISVISDESSIAEAVQQIHAFDQVDVLIHNAGLLVISHFKT
jgi:NADP-dependent 3-hydroxy acid dehydrogenase YdfG